MIKIGSRTEMIVPYNPTSLLAVVIDDKVHAGDTVMARISEEAKHSNAPEKPSQATQLWSDDRATEPGNAP